MESKATPRTSEAIVDAAKDVATIASVNASVAMNKATEAVDEASATVVELVEKGEHRLEEAAQAAGHSIKETATKAAHAVQETAQKVLHSATEAASKLAHRRDERMRHADSDAAPSQDAPSSDRKPS